MSVIIKTVLLLLTTLVLEVYPEYGFCSPWPHCASSGSYRDTEDTYDGIQTNRRYPWLRGHPNPPRYPNPLRSRWSENREESDEARCGDDSASACVRSCTDPSLEISFPCKDPTLRCCSQEPAERCKYDWEKLSTSTKLCLPSCRSAAPLSYYCTRGEACCDIAAMTQQECGNKYLYGVCMKTCPLNVRVHPTMKCEDTEYLCCAEQVFAVCWEVVGDCVRRCEDNADPLRYHCGGGHVCCAHGRPVYSEKDNPNKSVVPNTHWSKM